MIKLKNAIESFNSRLNTQNKEKIVLSEKWGDERKPMNVKGNQQAKQHMIYINQRRGRKIKRESQINMPKNFQTWGKNKYPGS